MPKNEKCLKQEVIGMQIRINNKSSLICLLLCFLFLAGYVTILVTNGIIPISVNAFDIFSSNGEQSSMNGGANAGHDDYMTAVITSCEASNSSIQQSRSLNTKASFRTLAAIASVQTACSIYYTRLSDRICTQFNSISISAFLHKKDGMK
jgi:hypothetical protein